MNIQPLTTVGRMAREIKRDVKWFQGAPRITLFPDKAMDWVLEWFLLTSSKICYLTWLPDRLIADTCHMLRTKYIVSRERRLLGSTLSNC